MHLEAVVGLLSIDAPPGGGHPDDDNGADYRPRPLWPVESWQAFCNQGVRLFRGLAHTAVTRMICSPVAVYVVLHRCELNKGGGTCAAGRQLPSNAAPGNQGVAIASQASNCPAAYSLP